MCELYANLANDDKPPIQGISFRVVVMVAIKIEIIYSKTASIIKHTM